MPNVALPQSIPPYNLLPSPSPPLSFASRIDAWLDTTRTPESLRRRSKRRRSDQDPPALGQVGGTQEIRELHNKRAKLEASQTRGASKEVVDTMQRGQQVNMLSAGSRHRNV